MSQTKTKPAGRVKSSVLKWLGVPIALTDTDFWSAYLGGGSFTGRRVCQPSAPGGGK